MQDPLAVCIQFAKIQIGQDPVTNTIAQAGGSLLEEERLQESRQDKSRPRQQLEYDDEGYSCSCG